MAFPENAWGNRDSALSRAAVAFASTRAGSVVIRTLTPLDRRVMARTKGRYTLLGPVGAPTLLLTTIGRRSGLPRQQPLLCARDGDALIVAGSNFGQDHHPAWTANLIADPRASVAMGGRDIAVIATRLDAEEAERAYRLMSDTVASAYATYRGRTDREIRVFRLTEA